MNRHAVGIHPEGVLNIAGDSTAVGHIVEQNSRIVGHSDALGYLRGGRDAGADHALSPHQHIDMRDQGRDDKVDTLKPRRRTHYVAVIKGQHDRVA